MEARRAHNPEVVGSSPASATIKTPDFDKKSGVFLTFWWKIEQSKMPWGIAAGIVSKYAFSENRELQTFCQYFAFRISCFFQGKTGHKINIAAGVSAFTRIDGVSYSLPSSQSTDTFRISARAFNLFHAGTLS